MSKIDRFRSLHQGPDCFVLPNAWDAASAQALASLGFPALATSSEAIGLSLGRADYEITRDESLSAASEVVEAAGELPVSADLENGFGDSPETVAETISLAGATGLAGCSIEDAKLGSELYPRALAVERVTAAVEANRALGSPMMLTARVEHYLQPEDAGLADTIERLQAYASAGADVLFAPGLPDLAAVATVCAAVDKPVSVIGSMAGGTVTVGDLAAAGVRRVSTATSLYRVDSAGFAEAALEIRDRGAFTYAAG